MGYYNDDEPKLQTIDVNTKKTPKSAASGKKTFDEYEEEPTRKKRTADGPKGPSGSSSKKKKKKKVSGVSVMLVILIACLLVACAILAIVFLYKDKLDRLNRVNESDYQGHEYTVPSTERADIETTPEEEQTTYSELELEEIKKKWEVASNDAEAFFKSGEAVSADYVKNILLIGTDLRPAEVGTYPGNSDTCILVSINEKSHKVVLTSFMRDTIVYIPSSTPMMNRLNHSHAIGDAGLLMETLGGNFKIKVDQFIRVNINDLIDIIDAVGGIDMEVSEAERKVLNETYIYWMCYESIPRIPNAESYYLQESGQVHLTGMQAVAYARIRYVGNADYERTERQRKVIMAMVDNCKKMNVTQLNNLANTVLPLITTNLTDEEITSYLLNAFTYMGYTIQSQRVPFPDTSTAVDNEIGWGVLLPDYKTNAEYLLDTIYGD